MSAKNLFVLAIVLVVLAAAAFLTRSTGPARIADAPTLGDPVLPGLDVNQTRSITIEGPAGTNRLAYAGDQWVVSSLHDYPADFTRIREQLTGLLDLKVGQVMRADDATRAEAGLGEDAKVVTLRGSNETATATIRIGKARTPQSPAGGFGGYPDGQYIAVDEQNIVVVGRALQGLSERPTDWIARELLKVDAQQIASVAVVNGEDNYRIQIDTNQVMTLEGLGEDETLDATAANRLKQPLSYLSCQDVADPALSDEAMGLDQPATYTATLRDGHAYVVTLGATTNNARYARFAISGGEPVADEDVSRLQGWTYLIQSYAADSMTVARATLVKPVEKEEEVDGVTEPAAVEPEA